MVGIDDAHEWQARLTFAMARHAVVDLCAVFHLKPSPPDSDRLPAAEMQRIEKFLTDAGYRLRSDEACLTKFSSLRAMYEPYVQVLSVYLLMRLPQWVPPEGAQDNWQATA